MPSLNERIESGKVAIKALAEYRRLKAEHPEKKIEIAINKTLIDANMQNFGYGYIKDEAEIVPYIPLCFYAFRVMVGIGTLLLLFFLVAGHVAFRMDISKPRWLHIAAIVMLPLTLRVRQDGLLPRWAASRGPYRTCCPSVPPCPTLVLLLSQQRSLSSSHSSPPCLWWR